MNKYTKYAAIALASAPLFAYAQAQTPQTVDQVFELVKRVLGYVQYAFWIVAIGAMFYAAYLYMFSKGDQKKTDEAKAMFKYAIIGMIVALVSYAIPKILQSFFGGTITTNPNQTVLPPQ